MSAPASAHGRSSSVWTSPRPHPDPRRGSEFARERVRMKVLFTKRTYAPMGGSESLAYQWASRLAARGHDVRVVCGQAFDDRPRFEDRGVDVIQVKPRGGFLGHVADASTLVDLMRGEELERYAEDRDLILYVGRRERYKGYIHLLDAAELVWQRHDEARFVFIGVPGFYGAVIDEFARYTDERIIVIERAVAAEKSAALDACDVYAMPSAHETFGIGYLEAWLHEKPVIGGDIPPLREVIAHGVDGLLVPQNVEAIARAITHLLDDPVLRRAMGVAGNAKLGERWDWERVMDRVEDAHRRAIGAHLPADEALA